MDEEELEQYLELIDEQERRELWRLNELEPAEIRETLIDQLRDEDGMRVPGCYRINPAPSAE